MGSRILKYLAFGLVGLIATYLVLISVLEYNYHYDDNDDEIYLKEVSLEDVIKRFKAEANYHEDSIYDIELSDDQFRIELAKYGDTLVDFYFDLEGIKNPSFAEASFWTKRYWTNMTDTLDCLDQVQYMIFGTRYSVCTDSLHIVINELNRDIDSSGSDGILKFFSDVKTYKKFKLVSEALDAGGTIDISALNSLTSYFHGEMPYAVYDSATGKIQLQLLEFTEETLYDGTITKCRVDVNGDTVGINQYSW